MVAVPKSQHTTAEAVIRWRGELPQEHRAHMGASVLGHACERHIWYLFRNALLPKFDGRLLRLFERGKREEEIVHQELRAIGVELHVADNGKQIDCRDSTGHIGGSVDGIGKGFPEAPKSWAILEVKTHSAKSFKDMQAKGVKESKPAHYAQMQVYMGLLELERSLYFAVNKDCDELYTEWVHFDAEAFDALINRGRRVLEAKEPPPKLSEDPAFWQCKGCQHAPLCHEGRVAEANCRTCCHATPVDAGAWRCDLRSSELSREEQLKGCGEHLLIPTLIPYADPVDGGEGYVEYRHRTTGKLFRNGAGGLSSKELHATIEEMLHDPVVQALKSQFGATVVASSKRGKKTIDLSGIPEFVDDEPSDIKI